MRLALIDELLAEQRTPTAVEAFARKHEHGELPAQARYYRDLIPTAAPGAGQQYAFEVDIDACTSCKGCVTACHRLNGLAPGETWRRVGQLQGSTPAAPVRQTITTACHHCLEPACLSGCPVKAYHKDPATGIVHHLDDQCIGCKYCLFTCPYEVPQYNPRLGIVRKCDMCADRLGAGEAPACVQACPNQAIRIGVVDQAAVLEAAETSLFLPGAPDPGLTLPTTTYRSALAMPRNTLPVDYYVVRREASHPPLVLMLVLTQLAIGVFGFAELLRTGIIGDGWTSPGPAGMLAMIVAIVALGASTAHLGRPHLAFRAVLGLRTSWLSREIVAFGAFVALVAAHVAALRWVPAWDGATGTAAAVVGVAALHSSVMVYVATRRECWRAGLTGPSFVATAIVCGATTLLLITGVSGSDPSVTVGVIAAIALLVQLLWEGALLAHVRSRRHTVLRRRAQLLLGELRSLTLARFYLAIGALGCLMGALSRSGDPFARGAFAVGALTLIVGAELIARHLFFLAAPAPRMPGESP
jgi:Fe-S-cluster-containing dehydrogenase component/DMSO reductase anchor subunit